MILIILCASWLRTWQIDSQGILFSDAGRDLLVAQQAVESNTLPLLGIPSSVPRFHQGPLTIWLEMLVYSIFGHQTLAFSLTFAFLGILAVIAVYEYAVIYINKPTAIIAAALLAFSPLAIAHSRVPYHTTPIPFTIVLFLFALNYLWQKKKHSVLVAGLAWALIMQFELSLFPLGLMILYILWRQNKKIDRNVISQLSVAGIIGFLPQIIHDLTQPISQSQIGGFITWVGYRVISSTGAIGSHRLSINRITHTISIFGNYFHKIFGAQNIIISIIFLGILITTIILLVKRRKSLKPGTEIVAVTTALLTLSYFVHGSPSEAYFPPYLALLSLILAWGIAQLFIKHKKILIGLVALWALINTQAVFTHKFFVSNPQNFTYHLAIAEQRQIIKHVNRVSRGKFQLKITDSANQFPNYFDNFRWLAQEMGAPEDSQQGMIFYIELKSSDLAKYPNITKVEFNTIDVYY